MSQLDLTEKVVACSACGFAAIVGPRTREWQGYRTADAEHRVVCFRFCTACGITYVDANSRTSRQPGVLKVSGDSVVLAPWELVDPSAADCPSCGNNEPLFGSSSAESELRNVVCPACWSGPVSFTDLKAVHPRW
jgi:DNA-directed RNA polymerase subunit RPC12/RpoP